MSVTYTDLWRRDAVLKMFDQQATPYYEVFQGKEKKFDSIDHAEDIEDAKNYLDTQLQAIEHFGSPAMFRISFYRRLSEKEKFTPDNLKGSNTFKLSENGECNPGTYWGDRNAVGSVGNPQLERIEEMLLAQQSQINALLEDPDDTTTQEPAAVSGVMGMLAGILNNPAVQEAIAAKAIGFLNSIIPDPSGKTMTMQANPRLGNISQDDIMQLNIAVTKLVEHGITLQDFQKLAALTADKPKFDMLVSMLRTM
jgi:hypothetical protein